MAMSDPSIRSRLLELEQRSEDLEERFRKEMNTMFEKKLSPAYKIAWTLATIGGACFAVLFTYMAIVTRRLPWLVPIGFIEGVIFSLAWVWCGVSILRKKTFNWIRQDNMIHGLTFGFMLVMVINLMLLSDQLPDATRGIMMMLSGAIFFLIFGIPAIFNMRINRTEVSLREHLLKIELKVAELAEKLK
jgi:hypothetical protein